MKTIAEILAHQFVGNHASDSDAFSAICLFAEDEENSMADRAAALRHMAQAGMGFEGKDAGEGISDEEYVLWSMKF